MENTNRTLLDKINSVSDMKELKQLEQTLAADYGDLSREYIQSRLARTKQLQSNISQLVSLIRSNEAAWNNYYSTTMDKLDDFLNYTEELIQYKNVRHARNKSSLDLPVLLENPVLPDSITPSNNFFFNDLIMGLLKPHEDKLQQTLDTFQLDKRLYQQNMETNKYLTWLQFFKDKKQRKEELIESLHKQKHQLDKEYLHLNSNEFKAGDNKKYYNSFININQLVSRKKNNKPEIQDIKRNRLNCLKLKSVRPPFTLAKSLTSLDDEDQTDDLNLIKLYKRRAEDVLEAEEAKRMRSPISRDECDDVTETPDFEAAENRQDLSQTEKEVYDEDYEDESAEQSQLQHLQPSESQQQHLQEQSLASHCQPHSLEHDKSDSSTFSDSEPDEELLDNYNTLINLDINWKSLDINPNVMI